MQIEIAILRSFVLYKVLKMGLLPRSLFIKSEALEDMVLIWKHEQIQVV